jgi:hypothetical protein
MDDGERRVVLMGEERIAKVSITFNTPRSIPTKSEN